jgi:hypothetical protein
MSCPCPCWAVADETWPLMECEGCGHHQTFAGRFVVSGQSFGVCDKCGANKHWKLYEETTRTRTGSVDGLHLPDPGTG